MVCWRPPQPPGELVYTPSNLSQIYIQGHEFASAP